MGAACSNTCDSKPSIGDSSGYAVSDMLQSETLNVMAPVDEPDFPGGKEYGVPSDLDGMLEAWVRQTEQITERYRIALEDSPGHADAAERIEDASRRVQVQLRELQLLRTHSTWFSDEAQGWLRLYTGKGVRLKSLRAVATKVSIENSVVRHWRSQVDRPENGLSGPLADNVAVPAENLIPYERWDDVDIFEVCKRTSEPLTQVVLTLWDSRRLCDLCQAPRGKILDFFRALELNYKENPFHNGTHAADVTLAGYWFWARLADRMPGYFTEIDLLVILIATSIHDVAHPSVSNDFLIKTKDELAMQYNDRSVLENMHTATGFRIMRNMDVALLEHNLPSPSAASLRSRVIDMVLATDMAKHKEVVEDLAYQVTSHSAPHEVDKLVLEKQLVHMADLAHPLRAMTQHREWTRRLTEEFFAQGDLEKKLGFQPMSLFDREVAPPVSTGQVGFLTFVIAPCWRVLCDLLRPEDAEAPDGNLRSNLAQWQTESKAASG
mmetsp:Transcript_58805/g.140190  ORF Transcript_58805/g.140190 Transcript_58805/m.140190 type:complete len:494 (+) Transcript_58805:102-1583(+)